MAGLKNIKLKIQSVGKTRKVTRAMEAVSAVKMRKARMPDAVAISRLENNVWQEVVVSKYDASTFIRFGYVFVAVAGKEIVASISAIPTNDGRIYVLDFVVDRKHRGKGIGEKLYRTFLKAIRRKSIVAFTAPDNTPSIALHKKLGFDTSRVLKNPYHLPSAKHGGDKILCELKR